MVATYTSSLTDNTLCIETPLGNMLAQAVREGITKLSFVSDLDGIALQSFQQDKIDDTAYRIAREHLNSLSMQLHEYFERSRTVFDVPISLLGTAFQRKVWSLLTGIPFGTTLSYRELSEKYGDPKAIRAVAAANGANPVAILVPCHRVIGSDGSLTGYAGGLWRKRWLLDHEGEQLRLRL